MGIRSLPSARITGLGLGNWDTPHLEELDRLPGRELAFAALLLVAAGSALFLICNRVETYCNEIDQVALPTTPIRRVNARANHRTRDSRHVGLAPLENRKP